VSLSWNPEGQMKEYHFFVDPDGVRRESLLVTLKLFPVAVKAIVEGDGREYRSLRKRIQKETKRQYPGREVTDMMRYIPLNFPTARRVS